MYPSDTKHKFRKALPCPFDTVNYPKTTVKSRSTPNYLGSYIFVNEYFKRKWQFLKNAVSLVKLLFSDNPGNQVFTPHFIFFLPLISRIPIIVL